MTLKNIIISISIILGGLILLLGVIILSVLVAFDYFEPAKTEEQLMIQNNGELLRLALIENVTEYKIVALRDLTPFEWDRVLFFEGYTSPETMYDAVGYEWDRVSFVGEFATNLIFLLNGKVVCYLTKHSSRDLIDNRSHTIYTAIRSEKNELLKEDDPKFLVTELSTREYTHGTSLYLRLEWFDDTLNCDS